MVRSRQLASVPTRSGPIRLSIAAVERGRDRDGTVHLLALHGVNAGLPWRLTMSEALAAFGTGRYVFEVEFQGERRRADVLGSDGARRLYAPSPEHGDLIAVLPEWGESSQAASRDTKALATTRAGDARPSTGSAA